MRVPDLAAEEELPDAVPFVFGRHDRRRVIRVVERAVTELWRLAHTLGPPALWLGTVGGRNILGRPREAPDHGGEREQCLFLPHYV